MQNVIDEPERVSAKLNGDSNGDLILRKVLPAKFRGAIKKSTIIAPRHVAAIRADELVVSSLGRIRGIDIDRLD